MLWRCIFDEHLVFAASLPLYNLTIIDTSNGTASIEWFVPDANQTFFDSLDIAVVCEALPAVLTYKYMRNDTVNSQALFNLITGDKCIVHGWTESYGHVSENLTDTVVLRKCLLKSYKRMY